MLSMSVFLNFCIYQVLNCVPRHSYHDRFYANALFTVTFGRHSLKAHQIRCWCAVVFFDCHFGDRFPAVWRRILVADSAVSASLHRQMDGCWCPIKCCRWLFQPSTWLFVRSPPCKVAAHAFHLAGRNFGVWWRRTFWITFCKVFCLITALTSIGKERLWVRWHRL